MTRRLIALAVAVFLVGVPTRADNPLESKYGTPRADPGPEIPLPPIDPAPRRALRHLGHVQHATGGWGHFDVPAPTARKRGLAMRAPEFNDALSKRQRIDYPPTLAETGAALGAFCAAGVSPAEGPGAKPLQAALGALENQAQGLLVPPPSGADGKAIEAAGVCGITRAVLSPALDNALALDGLLACRAALRPADGALRTRVDRLAGVLIARLKAQQRAAGGGWDVDEKVDGTINYFRKMRDDLPPAERSHWWLNPAAPHPVLADAFIVRTLLAASRAGVLAADDELTRGIVAYLQDLAGPAAIANEEPGTFYRSVIQLCALRELEKLAETDADRADRRQVIAKVEAEFFKALRAARGADGKTPLDVPVSSVDLLAEFLLIEALAGSTHPDARPTVIRVTAELARKQLARGGGWDDPNRDDALNMHWRMLGGVPSDNSLPVPRPSDHLVTALGVRVLLMAPKP